MNASLSIIQSTYGQLRDEKALTIVRSDYLASLGHPKPGGFLQFFVKKIVCEPSAWIVIIIFLHGEVKQSASSQVALSQRTTICTECVLPHAREQCMYACIRSVRHAFPPHDRLRLVDVKPNMKHRQ
jgi:hypothetical protein